MASQIPQTPRPPDGRARRRSFWWGVLIALAVVSGLWLAFNVYINWKFGGGQAGSYTSYGRGITTNGAYSNCGLEEVTVVVDGRSETVAPGQSRIWRFADRNILWSCGSPAITLVCREGTEYLHVIRYPDSDVLVLRCEILELPRLRDDPPSDKG